MKVFYYNNGKKTKKNKYVEILEKEMKLILWQTDDPWFDKSQ